MDYNSFNEISKNDKTLAMAAKEIVDVIDRYDLETEVFLLSKSGYNTSVSNKSSWCNIDTIEQPQGFTPDDDILKVFSFLSDKIVNAFIKIKALNEHISVLNDKKNYLKKQFIEKIGVTEEDMEKLLSNEAFSEKFLEEIVKQVKDCTDWMEMKKS